MCNVPVTVVVLGGRTCLVAKVWLFVARALSAEAGLIALRKESEIEQAVPKARTENVFIECFLIWNTLNIYGISLDRLYTLDLSVKQVS